MKEFKLVPVLFILALIVSACGGEAVPTINAADVQSTAVAAAFTLVAQTQAAIPSATPLPPTETPTMTPLPTDTPVSLPTNQATATGAAASNSSNATVDPCSNRVLSSPKGKETIIRLVNEEKVPIKVSMYLEETASHGECGYRVYDIGRNSDVVITDLVQGCYYLWAWSDDPKGKFNSSGSGCINNPDKWTFEVSSGSIKFVGP